MKRLPIDPELLRDRLAPAQGKSYWRSLEEITEDPAVAEMLQREFPDGAAEWTDPVSRRRFLTLMGASLALAGLSGCMRAPTGTIRPYARQPENFVLGKPLFYATSMTLSGYATGLLVESHEGRPTKIEGNPDHPASLGATSAMMQAAILGLYDPDRARTVTYRSQPRSWNDVIEELRNRLRGREKGERIAILTEAVGSPTLTWQLEDFLKQRPQARWFTYEPVSRDNVETGARLAFADKPYHCYHNLVLADVVVSLDADFLARGPQHLADTRDFTSRRRARQHKQDMNRLYALETDVTITGAKADHRLAMRPADIERFARALAVKVGLFNVEAPRLEGQAAKYLDAIGDDLRNNHRKSLIIAGEGQPPVVHALAHAINHRLGNVGRTVIYTDPVLPQRADSGAAKLKDLAYEIRSGRIDTLLTLGGNPAYTALADTEFAAELTASLRDKPKEKWLAIHCSPYFDETARLCHWHIPQSHFLEAWSDAVAFDGTKSVVQPLIEPLYGSKSPHEIIAAISRRKAEKEQSEEYDTRSGMELVQAFWKQHPLGAKQADFDTFWQTALHKGTIDGSAAEPVNPIPDAGLSARFDPMSAPKSTTDKGENYDIVFAPDSGVYDGRFANLGWMQEWPRPISRLTWDNAALISKDTARKLQLRNVIGEWKGGEHGDMYADKITISVNQKRLEVPVFIVPGHADGAVTLYLGYGRTHAGKVGTGVGVNANSIRATSSPWIATGATLTKARGPRHNLACVQGHHSMEGRDIVRTATLKEFGADEHALHKHEHGEKGEEGRKKSLPTLYPDHEYNGYKWGMAVDLTACVGCGACVTACQAENNTPIVGKEQVTRGREMHWLRIDRYFEMPKHHDIPRSWHFQPVMCQHCENAPCEVVCPVEATVHGDEGTNDMVYNRCVGTRYCSHSCPYKVRRFNFLTFTDYDTPSLKLLYNPDVSVRTRGVMEKCSFCIQRISYARIEASKEHLQGLEHRKDPNGRTVQGKRVAYINTTEKEPELLTACQAACPAEAIVFGDLGDKKSRVSKLHDSPLRYDLLGEHGVRPRVAYLGELSNPNEKLLDALKKLSEEK